MINSTPEWIARSVSRLRTAVPPTDKTADKSSKAALDKTVRNLREISPTVYFNVPRAYDMLVPLLREDKALRDNFFRKLKFIFYAGAALPHHLWTALEDLSEESTGKRILMVSSWGATETAPMATDPAGGDSSDEGPARDRRAPQGADAVSVSRTGGIASTL